MSTSPTASMLAAAEFVSDTAPQAVSDEQTQPMTAEEFLGLTFDDEGEFKYELVDGQILKTERTTNAEQLYILNNLLAKFFSTETHKNRLGHLHSEFHAKLDFKNVRRPDMGYLTTEQIYAAAPPQKASLVPAFAIEIISGSEKTEDSEEKLVDYFESGIQVVWWIYPKLQKVRVFHADGSSKICSGAEARCSAAPVLPDFEITVAEIFWHPAAA